MNGSISICQEDFDFIGDAARRHGMGALLVSEEDLGDAVGSMLDEVSLDNFEPRGFALISLGQSAVSTLARTGCAYDAARLVGYVSDQDQDECVVCFVERHHKRICDDDHECEVNFKDWMESAVERGLEVWRELCPA